MTGASYISHSSLSGVKTEEATFRPAGLEPGTFDTEVQRLYHQIPVVGIGTKF